MARVICFLRDGFSLIYDYLNDTLNFLSIIKMASFNIFLFMEVSCIKVKDKLECKSYTKKIIN